MANIASFPLTVSITGDGVSTSVVVGLGYTPASAALVVAYDANYNSVFANISSVVPGSSQVTINFVAAFSGTILVQLALSNATCASAQLQPVTGTFWQTTQPVSGTIAATQSGTWNVGTITTVAAVTAITNALPAGANIIGKVDILGNAGATLDAAINGAASTNAVWTMHAPSTAAAGAMATPVTNAALSVLNIKASAGVVFGLSVNNTSGTPIYIQFYNTAGTPVLGTSVIFSIACVIGITNIPISAFAMASFSTGIGIGASTSALSTGTPSVAPVVTVFFK